MLVQNIEILLCVAARVGKARPVVAVVIVAIVPDTDDDSTAGHPAIDIDDDAAGVASPVDVAVVIVAIVPDSTAGHPAIDIDDAAAAVASSAEVAVAIVAIVPDTDADSTAGHPAIDIDDAAAAVASPAIEDADVAAGRFRDFGQNYRSKAYHAAAAEYHGPDSDFAAPRGRIFAKQVEHDNLRACHCRLSDYYV